MTSTASTEWKQKHKKWSKNPNRRTGETRIRLGYLRHLTVGVAGAAYKADGVAHDGLEGRERVRDKRRTTSQSLKHAVVHLRNGFRMLVTPSQGFEIRIVVIPAQECAARKREDTPPREGEGG